MRTRPSVAEVDRERVYAPSVLMWTDPGAAGPDQRTMFATLGWMSDVRTAGFNEP